MYKLILLFILYVLINVNGFNYVIKNMNNFNYNSRNGHNFNMKSDYSHLKSMKSISKKLMASLIISSSFLNPNLVLAQSDWKEQNRLASETWRTVDSLYYDRTFNKQDWFQLRQEVVKRTYANDNELYKSLSEMISKLGDKYTRFLTPSQYSSIANAALGELTGVGCELLLKDDGTIKISGLQEDSPAFKSGLLPGDIINNVDGTETLGLSAEEVALLLRGKKDTKASVRILRGNNNEQIDYTVLRQPFKLKGVTSSMQNINGKSVGLIVIRSFSSSTRDDVMHAIEAFDAKPGDRYDSLVLDMRNNGGGLLQAAVETAQLFVAPGKMVVYVVDKEGKTEAQQTLQSGVPSADVNLPNLRTPLYVLVNSNTASAAEVLSAALKENDRAKLVGEKTFGKGVIQTLQELKGGAGVAVTIARYETPNHNNINKIGIPVDTNVACEASEPAADCIKRFL